MSVHPHHRNLGSRCLLLGAVSEGNHSQYRFEKLQIYRYINQFRRKTSTYDHRLRRIGHPVRSAIHKPQIGRLVVKWVTISEYLLLYVFFLVLYFCVKMAREKRGKHCEPVAECFFGSQTGKKGKIRRLHSLCA